MRYLDYYGRNFSYHLDLLKLFLFSYMRSLKQFLTLGLFTHFLDYQVGISYKKIPVTWRNMDSTYESSEGIASISFYRTKYMCSFSRQVLTSLASVLFLFYWFCSFILRVPWMCGNFGRWMGSLVVYDGVRAHGNRHWPGRGSLSSRSRQLNNFSAFWFCWH